MTNKDTYCIIMAGGLGSRFWPMSRHDHPKQFIDIMGTGETMLQSTFHRLEKICPRENIIIVTSGNFSEKVRNQIPQLEDYQVLCEPNRRNTAPCIAFAASVIYHMNPNATIVVTPSDHAIFGNDKYINDINEAINVVNHNDWIITMGAKPTNPNTKYGYIQFSDEESLGGYANIHPVITFTEKPPVEMATEFINSGEFFWNAGIFIWKLSVLIDAYKEHLPMVAESFFSITKDTSREELENIYASCESISVDFGIIEKAQNVHVMEANFGWSDVETWDTLYEACPKDEDGNVFVSGNIFSYDVKNTIVHIPQNRTIIIQGLDGYVVTGNANYTMICRRDQTDRSLKFASDVEVRYLTKKKKK